MMLIALWITRAVSMIWAAAALIAVLICVAAFLDCLRYPAALVHAESGRSKTWWLIVNAASALAVALLGFTSLIGIIAVTASAVYMADVRPRLANTRRARGPHTSRRGR